MRLRLARWLLLNIERVVHKWESKVFHWAARHIHYNSPDMGYAVFLEYLKVKGVPLVTPKQVAAYTQPSDNEIVKVTADLKDALGGYDN
jgi:hypothetical protein